MNSFTLNAMLNTLSFNLQVASAREHFAPPVADAARGGEMMAELEQLQAIKAANTISAEEIASHYRATIQAVVVAIKNDPMSNGWLVDKVLTARQIADKWAANQRQYQFNFIRANASLIGANPTKRIEVKGVEIADKSDSLCKDIEATLASANVADLDETADFCARLKKFPTSAAWLQAEAQQYIDYCRRSLEAGKNMVISPDVLAMARGAEQRTGTEG